MFIGRNVKGYDLQFSEYLRSCREDNQLTQEEIVHGLYIHDMDHFKGLDTSTLSKWERGVTKPKASKQVSIIKYFKSKTGKVLPCWECYSMVETEALICKAGMYNLIAIS